MESSSELGLALCESINKGWSVRLLCLAQILEEGKEKSLGEGNEVHVFVESEFSDVGMYACLMSRV